MIWLHYCVGIIDASWVCILCVCACGFFCVWFPLNPAAVITAAAATLPSGKQAAAFIFYLFILPSGWHSVPTAPFDLRQSPAGQKTFEETWGRGRSAPRPRAARVSGPSRPDPKPSRPTAPPLKNHFPFYPPGPGREAAPRQRASTQGLTFLFSAGTCWLASLSGIPSV